MKLLRKIAGFVAWHLGCYMFATDHKDFKEGWKLGSGLKRYDWFWASKPYGKIQLKFAIFLCTQLKMLKWKIFKVKDENRDVFAFSFGFGLLCFSKNR